MLSLFNVNDTFFIITQIIHNKPLYAALYPFTKHRILNPTDISILIQEKTYEARQKGIDIYFLWIPGHCGIDGNELADQEARKAASSNDTQMLNLRTFIDFKKLTQNILYQKW